MKRCSRSSLHVRVRVKVDLICPMLNFRFRLTSVRLVLLRECNPLNRIVGPEARHRWIELACCQASVSRLGMRFQTSLAFLLAVPATSLFVPTPNTATPPSGISDPLYKYQEWYESFAKRRSGATGGGRCLGRNLERVPHFTASCVFRKLRKPASLRQSSFPQPY